MLQFFSTTQYQPGPDPKFWKPLTVRIQSKTSLVRIQSNPMLLSVLRIAGRSLSSTVTAGAGRPLSSIVTDIITFSIAFFFDKHLSLNNAC